MRLIDADAYKSRMGGVYGEYWEEVLDDMPTIDAVEVVRSDCNGCKFVGTYDTEFPCANCSRKTKDYYAKTEPQTHEIYTETHACVEDEPQTERSE